MSNFPRFEAWCEERGLSRETQAMLLNRLVVLYGIGAVDLLDARVYYEECKEIAYRLVTAR